MNILYIDHYAGSSSMGMEFRPYYFSKEWRKKGHNVRILTASFSHLRKSNPRITKNFSTSIVDGIEYQWVKTGTYSGNGVSRIITMSQFCWKLFFNAAKIAKDFCPDIVIASSTYPMDAYAANRIAQKSGGLYIHEVHDMWPITPIELYGMSPNHPFVVVVQHAENYFCKHANKVVSILPYAKEYFIEHGMEKDKFIYVPNGIELSDWENPEDLPDKHKSVLNKAHSEGRFVIGFFGSHTRSYSIDYLIKALGMAEQSKLFVAFVGEGNYKEDLRNLAGKLKISKDAYCFLPSINKKAIPSLIHLCDASYVGAIKNKMFRFGIGMNKLFDAMMGGKPILYAVDAPNDLVKEYNCGISVQAEDATALMDGINRLMEMDKSERDRLGQNGKMAIVKEFTYPVLSEKFLEEVKQ